MCRLATQKSNKVNLSNYIPVEGYLLPCYHVAACIILLDVQHDHVLKSWILTFWSHPQGRGVCMQNICYHVAACVVPINLLRTMTIFCKSWIWPFGWDLNNFWDIRPCIHLATFFINKRTPLRMIVYMVRAWHSRHEILMDQLYM